MVIIPTSSRYSWWKILVNLAVIANAIQYPYRMVAGFLILDPEQSDDQGIGILVLLGVCELF